MGRWHNIIIDFQIETDQDIHNTLDHHIHTEEIGEDMFQVGISVKANSPATAFLRAHNLLEAELEAYTGEKPDIIEVWVYSGDQSEKDGQKFA